MSAFEENWQTRPTIRERSKFIFNNDLFSDVKFLVPKASGESESIVIPAHKFILSISSPVFSAMFYGELAETRDSIKLPDCEYDSLLEFFRYMYSDEVNLDESNVMQILYLANKYIVPSLADKCTQYLQAHLEPSNVFSILPSAQKYDEQNLVEQCWKVIDEQTEEAVKSDGFTTIERSLLEVVVERDTLTIKEIELFEAVNLWAIKECKRQGLAADGPLKRRVLGERLVKALRFPTMKLENFASIVLDSKILTPDEIVTIIKCLSSVSRSPIGFPETKRHGFSADRQRCCRFHQVPEYLWMCGSFDGINFSVDKDIVLHGLCLFGSENNSYSIDLNLREGKSKSVVVSKSGQFFSELFQSKIGFYYGFEVLFDRVVPLNKNTIYCIEAKIAGPWSLRGENATSSAQEGNTTVTCSGVTFTFMNSDFSDSGSNVAWGQFPEFLFSL